MDDKRIPYEGNHPTNRMLPLLAFGFVLAAWGAVAAGQERVRRLDLSGWGTDIDIPEQMAIDKHIARHFRPYIGTAIALDGLAYMALCWAGRRGRLRAFGVTVVVVWLLSAGWHGLNWLATSFFVTEGGHF